MTPTPAKLIEAMARGAWDCAPRFYVWDECDAKDLYRAYMQAALKAAANLAGYVMVERGLVEEAAGAIDDARCCDIDCADPEYIVIAARLRGALGEGEEKA